MTTAGGVDVRTTLPGGFVDDDGRRHRTVGLRAITGHVEELLTAAEPSTPIAAQVTAVLGRCLTGVDGVEPDEAARRLTVGDREALLLALRRATVGDELDCTITCPDDRCGGRIDLDLRVSDLLLPPYEAVATWYEERFAGVDGDLVVRFRLPSGADQEAVTELARVDPAAAADALLERCVASSTDPRGETVALDAAVASAVGARMAELDPQSRLELQVTCPWCETPISTVFDTASFLLAELAVDAERLAEEIHALASHYHWAEAEILGLTAPRRRRYLGLIAASRAAGQRSA
jgi:hypothetical protein